MNRLVVPVELGDHAYPIVIGAGHWRRFADDFRDWTHDARHAMLVTDANVEDPYALAVGEALEEAGVAVDVCVIEPGEASKCVEMAEMLWEKLVDCGATRQSVVVAVGGGVVGDLAGFVAATLNRGVRFIQVPTTLLAQVDSSVGGKTGINLRQGKNLVGAFWQPQGVFIDLSALRTLDVRQFAAGMAEVVKMGVILDADFFAFLERHTAQILDRDGGVMGRIVARCCELKAGVVRADERETSGRRAILNYGHTYGHVVETLAGYGTFLHGEAVGIGMEFAARLAQQLDQRPDPGNAQLAELRERQSALLRALGIPTCGPEFPRDAVLRVMSRDKKAAEGGVSFVLPARLGHVEVKKLRISDLPFDTEEKIV